MSRRRVVVSGMGALTPCGVGMDATWAAVTAGESGIAPITLFDASPMTTRFAGEVKGFVPEDHMDRKLARRLYRFQQFAMAAGEMAMRDAALVIPPTINLDQLDAVIDIDCVPNKSRRQESGAVMSDSFGFGGTNAVLIFARVDDR